jgi:hypothetical protein
LDNDSKRRLAAYRFRHALFLVCIPSSARVRPKVISARTRSFASTHRAIPADFALVAATMSCAMHRSSGRATSRRAIPGQLNRWVKAGGKTLEGLARRLAAEGALSSRGLG